MRSRTRRHTEATPLRGARWGALVGWLAAAAVTVTAGGPLGSALSAQAQDSAASAATQQAPSVLRGQNRYRATRPIVVDTQTRQRRMPTVQELGELVDQLATLTKRPEGLPETAMAGGAVAVDLDGGFAGLMLARPNEDGTFETLCVFTFEEGAEFLGLAVDIQ